MKSSSKKQHIARIFDPDGILTKSKLTHLSSISVEELDFFRQIWPEANVTRRRQITSHLVQLGEADPRLDFSSIFAFCLHDPDQEVRAQAITGLEEEEDHLLIPPLVKLLEEDASEEVRAAATTALGKFAMLGELGKLSSGHTNKVYTALLGILENQSETVKMRCLALESVAPLNLPRVKELIEEAYRSDDVELKASAICAMGRNCDPVWLAALLDELGSSDAGIRHKAATACGELGLDEAVPHLMKLIEAEDVRIQDAAIKAIGEIGSEQARQALDSLTRNTPQRIRRAAKSVLKEIDFCEDTLSLTF